MTTVKIFFFLKLTDILSLLQYRNLLKHRYKKKLINNYMKYGSHTYHGIKTK